MRAFSNKKQTLSAPPQLSLALPLFRTMLMPKKAFHFPFLTLIFLHLAAAAAATVSDSLLPPDAVGLLSFKSKADADNNLLYTLNERFDYCQWQGVKCVQGRVVRFVLQGFGLRGVFAPGTLSRLDQLRVLSLRNNSLTGPIPDLASLANLRSLLLDRNSFSGTFPLPLLRLHRLLVLDFSHNNMTGPLPQNLTVLDRLNSLRLDFNRFKGSIPRLNQSFLLFFNVSNNNLNGPVPVTSTLRKFGVSSFAGNPELCGEIINKLCGSSPFFEPPPGAGTGTSAVSPSSQLNQNRQSQQVVVAPPSPKKQTRVGVILGFLIGILFLIAAVLCVFALFKRYKNSKSATFTSEEAPIETNPTNNSSLTLQAVSGDLEGQAKHKQFLPADKSGDLIFCAGEAPIYTLDQLMRASAELLGRGSIGITYKAVMVNHLIVSVKRLDACKTAITSGEVFERHMEAVGGLRHPNLVPVRAYFQAKQERLIIYDYQPNGSLYNLIHGSRSTRAKPLHWTSCLKIAEDVAQGLAYIHQASRLSHANLKSSNVLLGSDFEACLTDYCLATLADLNSADDPDYARYKAPEIQKSNRLATAKSDVYAYGVLLLELLTGKHPSQHPFLAPPDMPDWVRAMREDDAESDNWLRMLVEVAGICSLTSPEQRPTMRQVLRMINEIKERAMVEDNIRDSYGKYS